MIDVTPAGTAAATAVAAVLKTGGTILVISLDAERLVTLEKTAKGTNTAVSEVAESLGGDLASLRDARYRQQVRDHLAQRRAARMSSALGASFGGQSVLMWRKWPS